MRITLPTVINNPDLEPADPLAGFLRPTFLAGYNMLDTTDFSGNNRNMTYTGAFNSQGAVLTTARANAMTMPVPEQAGMTVFVCMNIATSGVGSNPRNIISNLNSSITPYKGMRVAQRSNSAQADFQWARDTTPFIQGFLGTIAGAWTVRALRWTSSVAQMITHGGAVTQVTPGTLTHTPNPTSPFYFSGIPEGVTAPGVINEGCVGTAGMVLFYGEYLNDADCIAYMDKISTNMATRGVVVP